MPANRKPKAWSLKPHLTEAPNLWGRSKYCVVPFWAGTRSTAIVSERSTGTLFSTSGAPTYRNTILGKSRYFNGASRESGVAPGFFDGANEATLACYYIQRASGATVDEGVFGDGKQAEWDNSRAVQIVIHSGLAPRFFIADNSFAFAEGADNSITLNAPSALVGTWSASDGLVKIFNNGNLLDSVSGATAQLGTGHSDLLIGSYYNHGGRQIDADYLLCVALTYKWSDEEVLQWSRDPFAMIRPRGF